MTMNISILICSEDKDKRVKKAQELAQTLSNKEDILLFDAFDKRGIEHVRNLKLKLSRKPYNSKTLTAIVLEAQNLTSEAQNSLLKVLEEPNESSRLILTTPSEFSLLPTISSRCGKIFLKSEGVQEANLTNLILPTDISERLDLSEKLNLQDWITYLRALLKQSIHEDKASNTYIMKLVKYIRFVGKIHSYKQLANPKLANYLAVISIPKEIGQTLASL